ncbi:hypothetical protein [Microbacterium sp. SSM24]|uniref:hypothetical protein n=1 Tax=Microbacterium sp. SSM24 TaxID=2991714 RepID=UPI002227B97D|nr:hypothetical protein [Microbacterium sp. SSM24]MCW3492265.1 hypothetical protein [Microbacterium sp. SSM24]
MTATAVGSTELAVRVFGDASEMPVVSRWRHGRQRPHLSQLPKIADALGLSPLDLPAAMGIVDLPVDDPTSLARRVVDLESRLIRDVATSFVATSDALTAKLWRAVVASAQWTMSVYPAYEGHTGYEVLAATRLSFTRIDGAEASIRDVERDLGEELRAVGAAPSSAPVHPDVEGAVRYSIREHTRPRSPHPAAVSHHASSIFVLATTVRSWVSDLAAHLALPLGYGLTSPLDLAAAAAGKSISRTRPEERDQHASALLLELPSLYVAYHYEAIPTDSTRTLAAVRRALTRGQRIVWLDESDAMLRFAARHRTGPHVMPFQEDLRRITEFRDAMRTILGDHGGDSAVSVPVDLPSGFTPTSSRDAIRAAAARQVVDFAANVLAEMLRRGWVSDQQFVEQGAPALRRLRAREEDPSAERSLR